MYRNINIDSKYFLCYIIQTLPPGGERNVFLCPPPVHPERHNFLSVPRRGAYLHFTPRTRRQPPPLPVCPTISAARTVVPILLFTDHCSRTTVHCPLPPKSFKCNTSGPPRKCCKQKIYCKANLFRFNTYKKHGGPPYFQTFKPANVQPALLS